jgi:hypothetical protein
MAAHALIRNGIPIQSIVRADIAESMGNARQVADAQGNAQNYSNRNATISLEWIAKPQSSEMANAIAKARMAHMVNFARSVRRHSARSL